MDDLISRQAAIDALLAVTGNSSVRELYEHVQEHGLSDMWSGGVNAAIDIIIAVPTAQPKSEERTAESAQNVPNDELISKKSAIEVIDAVFPVDPMKSEYAQGISCGAALAKTYVEQLPSAILIERMSAAQPERTGKWTKAKNWGRRCYQCDRCGNYLDFDGVNAGRGDANYCPNCGARMEEREDE